MTLSLGVMLWLSYVGVCLLSFGVGALFGAWQQHLYENKKQKVSR